MWFAVSWRIELPANRLFFISFFFRLTTKKYQRPALLSFCEWNPPVTDGFPARKDSNAEHVSIWRDNKDGDVHRHQSIWFRRQTCRWYFRSICFTITQVLDGNNSLYYTPSNEVSGGGGGVYWIHPVCPSVCLSVRLSVNLSCPP